VGGGAYIWQAPCAPVLESTGINGGLAVSWTVPSANFVLQQNDDLATANWTAVTNTPVFDVGTLRQQVWLSMSNTSGFYRLKTQ
jgi:hypothetical protein